MSEEKKGFIKRDTFADRLEQDEKELEELKKQNAGEVEQQEEEPTSTEEATFKKRYGDLRRHSQQQKEEFDKRISQLEDQLRKASAKEMKLPKSEEEVAEWAEQYPDVAKIIETIAMKKAKEQASEYENRFKEIDSMHADARREKAEAELLRLHPDLPEIQEDDAFHSWLETQSPLFQSAVYDNTDDAKAAAAVITAYKAEMGIKTKKRSSKNDAAKDVNVRGSRSAIDADDSNGTIRESQVAKMTGSEYEKYADQIAEAIRTNKFIYDISGNAR
jgi:glucosamine 6-phosphate synthetase-like amidotransferase/phosphosugar isomerase protein